MLSALTPADVELSQAYGMYAQPGIATAYPELASLLRIMYRDRFAKLPFVPADWFDHIDAIHGKPVTSPNYSDILLPVPAFDGFGKPSPAMPSWIDNDAKRKAWDEARTALKAGYQNFTQNKIDEGREELNALYAKADFWNRLYNAAVYISELPARVAGTAFKVLWPYIIFGGAIFGAYWWFTHRKTSSKKDS